MDSPKDNTSAVNKKEEEEAASAKGKKCICNVCNREFINGYALGGHRRIHNSHKKTNNHPTIVVKKKIVKKKIISRAQITTNNVSKCYVCAKEFESKWSLIGHMRAHPDRGWPGLRPPSPPPTDDYMGVSSSSDGYSQASEFLPSSETSDGEDEYEDEEEEEEYEDEKEEKEKEKEKEEDQDMLDCADALLLLASGKYL